MTSTKNASNVRVAVVQAGAVPFDPDACVDKAVRLIAEAAGTGASVVVFPEAFIGGYPKGLSYGLVIGARDAAGREEFRRYLDAAIDVPSAHTRRLGEAAAAGSAYVVMGVIERDGGTCYCTVLFFGPDGTLLGKHRKLMPTALERMIWGFGDGSTLTVVDSPYGRIGSVICWENYMPMLRMAMYSKQVALYCAPTADDRDTWVPSMRHVALEGRCFVLTACQFLRKSAFPDDVRVSLGDGPDAVLMRGGSAIVNPLGTVIAGPDFSGETILTADLDLRDLGRAKFDFDVVGHYARPDVFQLTVNEAPAAAVVRKDAMATADREIVTTRVIDAPRARVFRAWTDARHLVHWWGPKGFTNTFHEFDPRPGGNWRFVMHGPNGANYDNESVFLDVTAPDRLMFQHLSAPKFQTAVTFADRGSGTEIIWRMVFDTPAERDRVATVAVDGNEQNLDRLEAELVRMKLQEAG